MFKALNICLKDCLYNHAINGVNDEFPVFYWETAQLADRPWLSGGITIGVWIETEGLDWYVRLNEVVVYKCRVLIRATSRLLRTEFLNWILCNKILKWVDYEVIFYGEEGNRGFVFSYSEKVEIE